MKNITADCTPTPGRVLFTEHARHDADNSYQTKDTKCDTTDPPPHFYHLLIRPIYYHESVRLNRPMAGFNLYFRPVQLFVWWQCKTSSAIILIEVVDIHVRSSLVPASHVSIFFIFSRTGLCNVRQ